MNYYIELTLIDSPNFSLYQVWTTAYTQLHLAFVAQQNGQEKIPFGVSFPQYRINQQKKIGFLGSKIRVFAHSENELKQLNLHEWFKRLIESDYVHVTKPREVPKDKVTGYALFYRVNPKLNLEQRIAHQAERHKISLVEAQQHFKAYVEQPMIEPYVSLKSLSAKREENIDRPYKLYIGKSLADEAKDGKFGTYGLSRTATVPEF